MKKKVRKTLRRRIPSPRYLGALLLAGAQSIGRGVRKTDIMRYLCALLVVAWAGCNTGCNTPSAPPAPERFGDPYDILTNLAPHAPEEPPAIVSDSLSALVAYAGGCAEHTFEAHARVTGRAAAILLRHDNGGDACEASLHDRIVLPLPANVLESPEIHLLHPKGGDPFILRWTPSQDEGTH